MGENLSGSLGTSFVCEGVQDTLYLSWRNLRKAGRSHWPSHTLVPESDQKAPMRKVPSPYWEERRRSHEQRWGTWGWGDWQTNLVKLTLILLVNSSPSLVHSFFTEFFFFKSKSYKSFLLWILSWVFIFLWRLPWTCENSRQHLCFSLFLYLSQFNFQIHPRTLRGLRKLFSSHSTCNLA